MKQVYGVKVEDRDYAIVEKIAGLLWGHSPLSYAEKGHKDLEGRGREMCARLALAAVLSARDLK